MEMVKILADIILLIIGLLTQGLETEMCRFRQTHWKLKEIIMVQVVSILRLLLLLLKVVVFRLIGITQLLIGGQGMILHSI